MTTDISQTPETDALKALLFLKTERLLTDRLVESLEAIADRLTAVESTAHGDLGDKIAATRSIVAAALNEWREVRGE